MTGRGKNAIEDHFDVSVELESFLEARGKREQLDEVRKISNMINFAYVRQGEPLGLGHAVLVTRELVGDEPFAVMLADDVIDADPPALKQMIDVFEKVDGPVLAVERVPRDEISNYGVIAPDPAANLGEGVYRVLDLVEKPPKSEAPSDLAIIGRYILTPDIFPVPGGHEERPNRRDSADQRAARAPENAADIRLRDQGRAARHGQQARVPEGGGVLRDAPARPRRKVLGVPHFVGVEGPDPLGASRRSPAGGVGSWRARRLARSPPLAGLSLLPDLSAFSALSALSAFSALSDARLGPTCRSTLRTACPCRSPCRPDPCARSR